MPTNSLTILAIDDHQDNLTALKAVVADAFPGARVLIALDGPKGIELALAEDPDVILLDIVMPAVDGFEVCRRLKADERLRHIPVVFLTALQTGRESRVKALEMGAEAFLSKPFDEVELTAQIRAMAKIKVAHVSDRQEKQRLASMVLQRTRALEHELAERKQAEEGLRQAHAELTAIYASVPVALLLVNRDRRVTKLNNAAALFAGRGGEEMLGLRSGDALRCLHSLDDPRGCGFGPSCASCPIRLAVMDTFADGKGRDRVEALLPAGAEQGGEERCLLISTAYLETKGAGNVLISAHDITERKRAEEELRLSRQWLALHVLQTPLAVIELDLGGRLRAWNPGAVEIFGFSREEAIGQHWTFLVPKSVWGAVDGVWQGLVTQRGGSRSTNENVTKDGRTISCEWFNTPLIDPAGKTIGVASLVMNVTERKRAEEALRESEEKYRSLVETAQELVWKCDSEGRFTYLNPAWETTHGYRIEEMLGRRFGDFQRPEAFERDMREFARHLAGGFVKEYETTHVSKQGRELTLLFNATPLCDSTGTVIGTQGTAIDITERKRAEAEREKLQAQLIQAQKMESIGRLAGGVAHDFNNLLTVINGYSRMLLGGLKAGDPLRDSIEEIHGAGERAAGLTQQLLAFSRKQVLRPRVLDFNSVVGEMGSMLARLVGEDVELRVELHPAATTIYADRHQLEQVVMNLAVNSRDAMPHGGKLSIGTGVVEWDESHAQSHPGARVGPYVVLAVSDSGVGMDEETRRHIFEPFFTTKEVGKGTGLGLSMIQGIVAQSGGYIEVYSEPGHGTTFKIYLPRVTDAVTEAEAVTDEGVPEAVPALGGKETVLVVEDLAAVRKFAVAALRAYGYRVLQAENASDALLLCEREGEHVDLVLTDVVMPNMSGRELANRLGKRWPGTKVLFMSGYTDDAIIHHGVLEKGAEFIQKPFSAGQMAIKVREMLGAPDLPARIVVADDEAGVRKFLRKVLEDGGYEVIEAANGKGALQEARTGRVDLVITDLVMPEQEGIETIQALRKDAAGIGIIAISGAFKGQFLKTAQMLGADAVLHKPVNAETLLASVAQVLKVRR